MRRFSWIACGMLVLVLTAGMVAFAQSPVTINVVGSDSMFGRINGLSKAFMKVYPNVSVEVQSGSFVDEGIATLIRGKADVAMASRELTEKEAEAAKAAGVELRETLIGYGGIVIIVHPSNPVNELTIPQVAAILKGETTQWSRVGGKNEQISVYRTGEKHPGTSLFLEREILGAEICKEAIEVPDFPSIMKAVSQTPNAVGYVRIRDAFESEIRHTAIVKPLKIKKDATAPAVAPSRSSIADGTYELKRPYYLYTLSNAKNEVAKLLQFLQEKGWGVNEL